MSYHPDRDPQPQLQWLEQAIDGCVIYFCQLGRDLLGLLWQFVCYVFRA